MPASPSTRWLGLWVVALASGAWAQAPLAISHGQGSCGRLEGGVQVPCTGSNFEAFSPRACTLGRTWLHPLVAQTLTDGFAALATRMPARRWQYGELGKRKGGSLWPHRTHQNGLSADFFVPVVDAQGAPAKVPIRASEKFGYALEFDRQGRLAGGLRIDWEALGAHLLALEEAGRQHGVAIERVILTPAFHRALFAAVPALLPLAPRFMKTEAWVRHDEHYHVDFAIPAALRRPLTCRR